MSSAAAATSGGTSANCISPAATSPAPQQPLPGGNKELAAGSTGGVVGGGSALNGGVAAAAPANPHVVDGVPLGNPSTAAAAGANPPPMAVMTGAAVEALVGRLFFAPRRVNAHTLLNKWVNVDETHSFLFQSKERKAITTQQCRIVVKGSKHFPLQLSSGPSTESLWPTWQYCRRLEDVIPRDITDLREKELWITNNIRELQQQQQGGASRDTSPQFGGDDDDDEDDDEPIVDGDVDAEQAVDDEGRGGLFGSRARSTSMANNNNNGGTLTPPPATPTAASGVTPSMTPTVDGGQQGFLSSFFLRAKRPQTKDEWRKRDDQILAARRNRTGAIMFFFFVYTLLMRVMSFDGFLLLQCLLQVFLFYVSTRYREISIWFARRGAENRVNRFKDWFYFGLTRHEERQKEEETRNKKKGR